MTLAVKRYLENKEGKPVKKIGRKLTRNEVLALKERKIYSIFPALISGSIDEQNVENSCDEGDIDPENERDT